MKQQEENIVYKLELLEDLVERQTKALGMADRIIELKQNMINLYEQENNRLRRVLAIISILLIIVSIINIIGLFI